MADPETWIAIGIGIATATGIIYSIIQGIDTSKKEQKKQVFETLLTLEGELTKIKEREAGFVRKKDSLTEEEQELVYRYASDYLNVLERISFLGITKYMDKDTIDYFKPELAYGLKLRNWKIEKKIIPDGDKVYPNLLKITGRKITENDDSSGLPHWLDLYPNR